MTQHDMAWNAPGDNSGKDKPNDKDPWTGGQRGQDGPPDLEEALKKLFDRLNVLFGGKPGSGGGKSGSGGGLNGRIMGVVVVVLALVWLSTGIYIVDQGKQALVLRFGAYHRTDLPGPHWHMPAPIERVKMVDVARNRSAEVGYRSSARSNKRFLEESLMLTKDENIVDIQFAVQYRIKSAADYVFRSRDPDATLRQATESAVREIVGRNTMDFALTSGRAEMAADAQILIQKILDRYKTGLLVTSVNTQDAQPPEQVQHAFDDAVKAREDEQRLKNEAEAYANDIIPRARGGAARVMEEAEAYKRSVTLKAEGESSRFSQVLAEYKKAPKVTRERLYLDMAEQVYSASSKVILDMDAGNNSLLYLPLDKMLMGQNSNGMSASSKANAAASSAAEDRTKQAMAALQAMRKSDRSVSSNRSRERR